MNKKISYIKLPNITTSNLQDVVNFLDDNEIEYVEYYAEDLQNRIDKAIEYMNGEEFFLLMNSIQTPDKAVCEDYFKAKGNLLEILKGGSDVDE